MTEAKHTPGPWESEGYVIMLEALDLVLMFHGAGRWDDSKRLAWKNRTGHDEATTRVLCDHLRAAIAKAKGEA